YRRQGFGCVIQSVCMGCFFIRPGRKKRPAPVKYKDEGAADPGGPAAGITLRRQRAGAGRGPISRSGIPAHLTASIPHRKAFVYNIFSRGLFPPPGGVLAVARRGKNCYTDGTDTAAPPSRRADGPLLRVCPF